MKKFLSLALAIVLSILDIMTTTIVAEEATAVVMAIVTNNTAEVGIDVTTETRTTYRSNHTRLNKRHHRKVRRIRSARKAKRNALRTARKQAERLVSEMVAARTRVKRHRIRRLLALPALMLCGLTATPTKVMATAAATSAMWHAKADTADQQLHAAKAAVLKLQAKLQVKQQAMAVKAAELSAKRAELQQLKEIRKDLLKQYDDVDIVTAQHAVMAAEAHEAEASEAAASVIIPGAPDLTIADANISDAKAKLEAERTAIAKKYGTRSVPKYVMKEFTKLQHAYEQSLKAKESLLAHYAEANSEVADKLSAAVEAKQEVESCKAALAATMAKADNVANEIAKAETMIAAARNEKATIEHSLKAMQDEYTILYATVKPELDKAEAEKAFAETKLSSLKARVATEEAREQAEQAEANSIGAYNTNDAGKHKRSVEAKLHNISLRLWTDQLEMKTIVGQNKDAVMAKYHETIATFQKYNFMKMELVMDGARLVKLFAMKNGKLVQQNEYMNARGKLCTIDLQFANAVVENRNNGIMKGHQVSEGDYHGHGSYPDYQLILLDADKKVASSVCYTDKDTAMAAFTQLSATVADSDWEAQLFEKLVLIRHTGDAIERAEMDGAAARNATIKAMTDGGLNAKDATKIADYFGVSTRKGEADLKNASIKDIQAVPGIGPKKAEKAYFAITDMLRDYSEEQAPTARYQQFIKLRLNDDGSITETHVNVKVSRMFNYLTSIAGESDAPAMLYFEHCLKEEEKNQEPTAAYILRDYVQNGLYRFGVKYVPALHGTNAGKTCTTIWVREQLRDQIRAYCTADGNMKAKITPAKFNAYMGLMAVGTDNMPFKMRGSWIGISPECRLQIKDRKVFVNGVEVTDVQDGLVKQPPFDGAMFCHFSNKTRNELLASAATVEEKIEIKNFLDKMESGSVRLVPWNKAMLVVGFDIHKWYKDNGVKFINCIGRGKVDVEDIAFFGTESVFKGSIGAEGSHATWADYEAGIAKYGYQPGYVLHAHKPKITNLPSQQVQCCAGISRASAEALADEASVNANALRTVDGVKAIAPSKEVGEMITRYNQAAAFERIAESLQKAFDDVHNTGMAGKLYNCAINAFVAPDPIAFASWSAWNDVKKIQTSIKAWHVVLDHNAADDNAEAIISRNPCTDLSALVNVTVHKNFDEKFTKYFKNGVPPMGIAFVSVLDTAATRLRMDFDGDHVNLCFSKAFINAVNEAVALWYPNEARHPVIDWDTPKTDKKALDDAAMQQYYAKLWRSNDLGHYMDLLTKLYSTIECDAIEITDDVKKAVAWLTYAVNVLVDASKHGMAQIQEPEYVKALADILLSKTTGFSKLVDKKEVDMSKVCEQYGNSILDVIAQYWAKSVDKKYELDGCDYNREFDPRVLETHTRLTDFSTDPQGKDLVEAVSTEMQSIKIYDLCNVSHWKFYPYTKDAEGNFTTTLVGALDYMNFREEDYFDNWDEVNNAKIEVGDYVIVDENDVSSVYYAFDYDENCDLMFEKIPGKWINHEAVGDKVIKYTSIAAILDGRKSEIANTYKVSGDKGERDRAAHDLGTLRKYTKWSAQQSIRAYAALYGYDFDDACDKMITWIMQPKRFDDQGNRVGKPVNRWLFDFVMTVCGDNIAAKFDEKMKNAAA